MNLKKPNPHLRKKEEVNRKAIYWIAGTSIAVIIIVSTLLILNV
jgi:hypothetical protein